MQSFPSLLLVCSFSASMAICSDITCTGNFANGSNEGVPDGPIVHVLHQGAFRGPCCRHMKNLPTAEMLCGTCV